MGSTRLHLYIDKTQDRRLAQFVSQVERGIERRRLFEKGMNGCEYVGSCGVGRGCDERNGG